jgi:hypothetical protein
MQPRLAVAMLVAIFFTALTVFFGRSFMQRYQEVAKQRAVLQTQLNEWITGLDPAAMEALQGRLEAVLRKLAGEEATRHVAAAQAQAISRAHIAVMKKLDEKGGAVDTLQDDFEDEFGRRISITSESPRQYDVGPAPTISSDPFRVVDRTLFWNKASIAVATFNKASSLAQPDLDRYDREITEQNRLITEATNQVRALEQQREEIQAQIKAFLDAPREHLPSPEEIRQKLANCTPVAAVFGISDGLACLTAFSLAVTVGLRTALIAGSFPPTQILTQ